MAVRILLADESLNVKKNLQIALQDYGVDVKTLLSGDEVMPSIKIFKPEIIFLDVLLAKISGYDLCAQIKNNPDLRHIPVILVWSNFMSIDEIRAKQCRADSTLEKPFDKESIRKLIQHFVPKTVNQTLNEFLKMPPLVSPDTKYEPEDHDEFVSKPMTAAFTKSIPEISPLTSSQDDTEDWSQKNINPSIKHTHTHSHSYSQMPLPTSPPPLPTSFAPPSPQTSPLPPLPSRPPPPPDKLLHKRHLATEEVVKLEPERQPQFEEFDVEIASNQMPIDIGKNAFEPSDLIPDEELIEGAMSGTKKTRRHPMMKEKGVPIAPLTLDEKHLEEIIRIQIHENIQHWIKKYMPEVAERLIKNEMDKLMKDLENDAT